MKNFKEIAEKCLAGELRGTFINRRGDIIPSNMLHKYDSIKYPYIYWETNCITRNGNYLYNGEKTSDYDIIDFIPDNMQKKIEIDIPEGKVPVMEQTEKGVVITWKEKELTYNDICFEFINNSKFIHNYIRDAYVDSSSSQPFYKKVEVLRKLTNIRNYFGNPTDGKGYGIFYHEYYKKFYADVLGPFSPVHVCFSTKEQAEQAIKMLGGELKYLFEPW